MKRKQFSEEQIIGILKEAEAGAVVTELCRKHGMSSATYYAWKAKFGGLQVSDAKRLRSLEEENARLKRLLADTMLDNAGLNDLLSKKMVAPAAKREAVAHLQTELGMRERRACAVVGADRKSMRYRSCREMMATCGRGFANWRSSAGGSAIGGCTSCFAGTASRSTARRPSGFTVRRV